MPNESSCWSCGARFSSLFVSRGDSCKNCGLDLKVCKNCLYYDPTLHNACHETQAERVVEKEKSNFCDYFKAKEPGTTPKASHDDLRNAANALFKKRES